MPSAAAEWHFVGICQLASDWPDIANPSRCSALTDECVTVSCGGGNGEGLGGSEEGLPWPAGSRVNRGPLGDHCPWDLGRFGGQDDPASGN